MRNSIGGPANRCARTNVHRAALACLACDLSGGQPSTALALECGHLAVSSLWRVARAGAGDPRRPIMPRSTALAFQMRGASVGGVANIARASCACLETQLAVAGGGHHTCSHAGERMELAAFW